MRGDEAISLARYVNQSFVRFQFNYGPLGLIDTAPKDAEYVAEQLQSAKKYSKLGMLDNFRRRKAFHFGLKSEVDICFGKNRCKLNQGVVL